MITSGFNFFDEIPNIKPDNFVIATNKTTSIKHFIEIAFKRVHIKIIWKGKRINEVGFEKNQKNTCES